MTAQMPRRARCGWADKGAYRDKAAFGRKIEGLQREDINRESNDWEYGSDR